MNSVFGELVFLNTILLVFILPLAISSDQVTSSVEPYQSGVFRLDFLNQTGGPWGVSTVNYTDWFAYLDNLDEMPEEARKYFESANATLEDLVKPADGIWAALFNDTPPIFNKPYPRISFNSAASLMEQISIKYFIQGDATIIVCIGSSETACKNVTTSANDVLSVDGWIIYENFSLTGVYLIELQVHEDGGFILIDKIECTPMEAGTRPPVVSTTPCSNCTTTSTTSTVIPQWPTTTTTADATDEDDDGSSSATRPYYSFEPKFYMLICILSFLKLHT